MPSSLIVSILMLWSGDFSARLQFDGPVKTEIKGEFLDNSQLKSEKNCDVYAHFDEVTIRQKNLPEKFLKIDFKFICTQDGQRKTIRLAPEFIRSRDLKTHSSTVFISSQFKKNSFKIEDFSIETVPSKK